MSPRPPHKASGLGVFRGMRCSFQSVRGDLPADPAGPAGTTTVSRTVRLSLARVLSSRASLRFAGPGKQITTPTSTQAINEILHSRHHSS
jgi:hypothetical protein